MIHPDFDETVASSTATEEVIQRSPIAGKKARKWFFVKIYLALSLQYMCYFSLVLVILLNAQVREFFYDYSPFVYIFVGIFLLMILTFGASRRLRTNFATNLIFLFFTTVSLGVCFATASSVYDVYGTAFGLVTTTAIMASMSATVAFSSYDVLSGIMFGFLALIIVLVLVTGISVFIVFFELGILSALISTISVACVSLYFFQATNMILAGRFDGNEESGWAEALTLLHCAPMLLIFSTFQVFARILSS